MQKHIETLISLWRKNGKSGYLSKDEIKRLGDSLLKLQRGLTGERNLAGKNYMQDPLFFGAYLLYYWPVSYIQIEKIIENLAFGEKFYQKNHFKILECGSGPAPGTCAILDKIFAENPQATVDVLLLDSSSQALAAAEKIIKKDFKNVLVKTKVSNLEKDNVSTDDTGNFDFILLSHVLNELWKNNENKIQKRVEYLLNLKKRLSENGLLILNEPSIMEASRNLILVRDKLLENGLELLSPCPVSFCKKCPVLETENHTCHAEYFINDIKILEDLSREAGLNRISVKMTFFVFSGKKAIGKPDSEEITAEKSKKILWGKIVSEGMLNKSGRIRFLVCDGEKRIPISAKTGDENAKNQGFFDLKRYDKIKIENPEIRENGFGMTGAKLTINPEN